MIEPYYASDDGRVTLYCGDAGETLRQLPDESVHCIVTSPPYWGLRDYGTDGQIGLEATPQEYIERMVEVFREVRRVLRVDGTCWVNMGDSYWGSGNGPHGNLDVRPNEIIPNGGTGKRFPIHDTLKPKDLCGIPWRLAFALQADGWWLRSEIIWSKPNPMPESVTDRPTKAHETIFLLTKRASYFYDAEAVREPHAPASLPRAKRGVSEDNKWVEGAPGSTVHTMSKPRPNIKHIDPTCAGGGSSFKDGHSGYYGPDGRLLVNPAGRNKRTVWTIATQAFPHAHFATFPEKLVEPCILAGTSERGCCPECGAPWVRVVDYKANYGRREPAYAPRSEGSKVDSTEWRPPTRIEQGFRPSCSCAREHTRPCVVLDPFGGSGTVAAVAVRLGRRAVLIELSPEYCKLAVDERLRDAMAQGRLFELAVDERLRDAMAQGRLFELAVDERLRDAMAQGRLFEVAG